MIGRGHLLHRTEGTKGEMRAEEEKIKIEKEMREIEITTGNQVALEITEMTENLVRVVTVGKSETTVIVGNLETREIVGRLGILENIEMSKKAVTRRIHVQLVMLMNTEIETIENPIEKMSSMMNVATEIKAETILPVLKAETKQGMIPGMKIEVTLVMTAMVEQEDELQIHLKKQAEQLEAPRQIITAAAATTMTTGSREVVTQKEIDTTVVIKDATLLLIEDMETGIDGTETEIKDQLHQLDTREGVMIQKEKKEEKSVGWTEQMKEEMKELESVSVTGREKGKGNKEKEREKKKGNLRGSEFVREKEKGSEKRTERESVKRSGREKERSGREKGNVKGSVKGSVSGTEIERENGREKESGKKIEKEAGKEREIVLGTGRKKKKQEKTEGIKEKMCGKRKERRMKIESLSRRRAK